MLMHYMRTPHFGININTKTVFSLQFVAIPPSGFHNTLASVLHNQMYFSIIKSLVLLFLFMLPILSLKPIHEATSV